MSNAGTLDLADLITIQEAADELNLHHVTVRRYIAAGRLDVQRLGPRKLRIRRSDLVSLFAPVPTAVGK